MSSKFNFLCKNAVKHCSVYFGVAYCICSKLKYYRDTNTAVSYTANKPVMLHKCHYLT